MGETGETAYRRDRALLLSGGGARGAYEIGVWKYLCEMKWRPDLICGTSVGSVNGAADEIEIGRAHV